jgi:glycosyltransferase involved in cell wall biosynthesis
VTRQTRAPSIAICAFQTLFTTGGAELLVNSLERELRDRGYSVEVVRIPFTWAKADLLQQALLWRLVKVDADLVIGTNFPSYFVKHDCKVIWLSHQYRPLYELYGTAFSEFGRDPGDSEVRGIIATADTQFISEARRVFTISRNVAQRLKRFNGIVAEPLYHPPPLFRSLFHQEYGDFLLMPSRLEAHKRPKLLVEALRLSRSPIKAVIAGIGSQEGELRRQVEQYGLEDRIQFAGFVNDHTLLKLYACCRAVVYAPYDEDYGYVTLEAFLAKKPVLTAVDSGGVLEFVTDERTGLVTEAAPEAVAHGIDRLAGSVELCRRLGEAGRERVKDISWDEAIRRLVAEDGP